MLSFEQYCVPHPTEECKRLLLGGASAFSAEVGKTQTIAPDGTVVQTAIVDWGPPPGYPGAPI